VEFIYKGRTWVEAGRVPHTRQDGSETELVRWATPCRQCGALFEVTTPVKGYESSKSFSVVHCSEHRLSPREASALARAQIQANRNAKKLANSQPGADLV
jgi:hypothetical protein